MLMTPQKTNQRLFSAGSLANHSAVEVSKKKTIAVLRTNYHTMKEGVSSRSTERCTYTCPLASSSIENNLYGYSSTPGPWIKYFRDMSDDLLLTSYKRKKLMNG